MAKVQGHGKASILENNQTEQLIASAPSPKYATLWLLQRLTAARVTEALSLTWGDIRGEVVTFRKATTKTGQTRQVPIAYRLREQLTAYVAHWIATYGDTPKDNEVLFPTTDSTTQAISRVQAHRTLAKTTKALGLEGVSTHTFRRSAATLAVRAGHGLRDVQALTGHKTLASLENYLDADPTVVKSIVNDF